MAVGAPEAVAAKVVDSDGFCQLHTRRTRSWSPPSLADSTAETGLISGDDDSDDATVLFDSCRFPRSAEDILDWVIGDEPWCEAETASGVRIVGEAEALKRLFCLPLSGTGKAICLHRLGNCLMVLDANEDDDLDSEAVAAAAFRQVSPRMCSPRTGGSTRCQVRVEGDMVRVYPSTETAEPVDVGAPSAATAPSAACCEWRVREGLSLVAVTPRARVPGDGACGLADLRSAPPRLLNSAEPWPGASIAGSDDVCGLDLLAAKGRMLPAYHRRVTEDHTIVLAVPLGDPIETEKLVDTWFSCCLMGSPSVLCFFVDAEGICRGCRFVAISEIPWLAHIAKAYCADLRCLAADAAAPAAAATGQAARELGVRAFDPAALRERSHELLEMLIARCDRDGGHCLVMPSPLGLHFLDATAQAQGEEEQDGDSAGEEPGKAPSAELALALRVDLRELVLAPQADSGNTVGAVPAVEAQVPLEPPQVAEPQIGALRGRLQQVHITQALLMYHAAVRLAQPRVSMDSALGEVKGVPIGSRWTAKSCRSPLRVRQMMLRSVRALRAANAVGASEGSCADPDDANGKAAGVSGGSHPGANPVAPLHRRFLLLLASACEFLADSFLAEDSTGNDSLEISRYLASLRHLRQSTQHLAEYMASPVGRDDSENFAQSVRRLEERVLAKRTNAHLSLARIRQQQPWREDEPSLRSVGLALRELDEAEALVSHPPRVAQPPRPHGPHECSLLASISKWKADLLHELASLAMPGVVPGAEVEPRLREYLEAQQRESQELPQPLPVQCERWLQSTISLSLRGLHQLAALPSEMAAELQLQARARLARAYGDLGRIYANTGRYTKAMTHAKQGIELFNATKDSLQAARLQLWLCRLQLRLAVPQAAPAAPSAGVVLEEAALLRGLSAAGVAEDTACTQAVQALQKVLKVLEGSDSVEQALQCEGQTLLGRVQLRQGLSRLASSAPLCAVCRLCEEDSALPGMLEFLQAAETSTPDTSKEAVELLLQANACFREIGDKELTGITHACLAAVYFCGGRQDARVQRLALTHCQHALDHLGDCGAETVGLDGRHKLRLAMQLLEARALRRGSGGGGGRGGVGRLGDARATVVLCDAALRCCHRPEAHAPAAAWREAREPAGAVMLGGAGEGAAEEGSRGMADEAEGAVETPSGKEEEEGWLRTAILASDEQKLPLMIYLKQELSELLLRLLRGNERQGGPGRELKALYCSLLTAWHSDTGQAEALFALRSHARGIVAAAGA